MRRTAVSGLLIYLIACGLPAGWLLADGRCPQNCPAPLFEAASGGPIYTTDGIVPVATGTTHWNDRQVGYTFVRNEAYPCGANGLHNFVLIEPLWGPEVKNLWVLLPAGASGYFDDTETDPEKVYYTAGAEPKNDGKIQNREDPPLIELLNRQLRVPGGLLSPLAESGEYRFLMANACDHDSFSGMGENTDPSYFYPNNPYRPDDRVEGVLALMSAVEYAATSRPTELVFLHGTSAGAYGAYAAAYAFFQRGLPLTGLILDSGLSTGRFDDLVFDFPPETGPCLLGQLANPDIDICQTREKNGPFFCDESLFAESTVFSADGSPTFDIPLYFLVSRNDDGCCGKVDPWLEEAIELGGNCEYMHDDLVQALAAKGDPLQVSEIYPDGDHVLSERAGPWHDDLAQWLDNVLTTAPAAPWPVEQPDKELQ